MSPVVELNSYTDFYRQIADSKAVVIDAYTTWCGPCRQMAPVFAQMASKYPAVTFAKIDIEKVGEVATVLNISSIPTFLFFKDGKIVDRVEGADPGKVEATLQKL